MRTVSLQEPVSDAFRLLQEGRHRDPFEVLGCHREGDVWQLRALFPSAVEAEVVLAQRHLPMQRLPGTDLFVCNLDGSAVPDYRLRWRAAQGGWVEIGTANLGVGVDDQHVRMTDAIGVSEPLARRVARNIQTILVQESSLAKVADPAGGSFYVERLSDEYARRAWALMQEIEAGGGMADALMSGRVADTLATSWAERERNLARRRDELTGVSSFPNLEEEPGQVVEQEALESGDIRRDDT